MFFRVRVHIVATCFHFLYLIHNPKVYPKSIKTTLKLSPNFQQTTTTSLHNTSNSKKISSLLQSATCLIMNNHLSSYSAHLNPLSATTPSDEEGILLLASSRPKKRAGRKKFKETRHPVYRGVRRRNNNKWVCELREPSQQKRIWLGTYPTPEMAARAHDVAALALRGNLATLNFADSRWRSPVPASKDPKDIRQAAVTAAQTYSQDHELVGVDYMNEEAYSSTTEEVKYQEIDIARDDNGSSSDFGAKELNIDMANVLCCKWGEENEMSEMEGWRKKMAEGLLFSPTPRLGSCFSWDDVESDVEVSLWSYNI